MELGRAQDAWEFYRAHLRPGASTGPPLNTLTNSASFLFRAEMAGEARDPELWRELSGYATQWFPAPGIAFADVHGALAHALAGNADALAKIVDGAKGPAKDIVAPISRAFRAFARSDWTGAIGELETVMAAHERVGGSRAQRDLIEYALVVSLLRAGRIEEARRLLQTRRLRRPNERLADPRHLSWPSALAAHALDAHGRSQRRAALASRARAAATASGAPRPSGRRNRCPDSRRCGRLPGPCRPARMSGWPGPGAPATRRRSPDRGSAGVAAVPAVLLGNAGSRGRSRRASDGTSRRTDRRTSEARRRAGWPRLPQRRPPRARPSTRAYASSFPLRANRGPTAPSTVWEHWDRPVACGPDRAQLPYTLPIETSLTS